MRPRYYDNVRRSHGPLGKAKFRTQDPLFFDYDHKHINGGIERVVEHIKDREAYKMPLRAQAYVLYHVAKNELYEPELFLNYEKLHS